MDGLRGSEIVFGFYKIGLFFGLDAESPFFDFWFLFRRFDCGDLVFASTLVQRHLDVADLLLPNLFNFGDYSF